MTRSDTSGNMPLYNSEGMRHNERVMRQAIERDRQTQPEQFRREGHQQKPMGRKNEENMRNGPSINKENIKKNKKLIEQKKERDRIEKKTDKEKAEYEHRKSALQKLRDFLNTKV